MCDLCLAFGGELDALWHGRAIAVYDDGSVAGDTAVIAYAASVSQSPLLAAGSRRDVIELDLNQFADFADVISHATTVGRNVVIRLDADHSITLQSVTLSRLVADNFELV